MPVDIADIAMGSEENSESEGRSVADDGLSDLVREQVDREELDGEDPVVRERVVRRIVNLLSARLGIGSTSEAPPAYTSDIAPTLTAPTLVNAGGE